MLEQKAESYPTIDLLFYVVGSIDDELREEVARLVRNLMNSRIWAIGPPEFVDAADGDESAEDLVETLGGSLRIYSAVRPLELPREIDIANLHEVEDLVDAVQKFSKEQEVNFAFELCGEFIGEIVNGELDQGLAEGLLGEWRRHLGL